MSFKTVLFDLDGTLIDSRTDLAAAVNHALITTGQPVKTPGEIIPYVGNGLPVLMKSVMGAVGEETYIQGIHAFSSFYDQHCVEHTVLYEEVEAGLRELSTRVKLAVVTNKPEKFAVKILSALKVKNCFSSILGGDSLPERKPHPAPLLQSIRNVGGKIETTLMVGDGVQDIKAGQAAGTPTCLARYGYGFNPRVFSPEVVKLSPDYFIDSFKEIKEIVL